jgi:type I restriction-modification system DNA methylase subunit
MRNKEWTQVVNICKKEMKKKRMTKGELIDMVYKRFTEKDDNKARLKDLMGGIG